MVSTKNRPFVILNAAMSLDGKIATRTGESRLSSKEDLRRVHKLRSEADAIMVGIGTVFVDDPKLTVKYFRGKNPARIVVDSQARTPRTSYLVRTARKIPTIVAVTHSAPPNRVLALERRGVSVIRTGKGQLVPLESLMKRLRKLGINKLLLEGGGTLNWSMLDRGLVDILSVAISPKIIGGVDAVSLVEGKGISEMDGAIRLRLLRVRRYGACLVISYRVLR